MGGGLDAVYGRTLATIECRDEAHSSIFFFLTVKGLTSHRKADISLELYFTVATSLNDFRSNVQASEHYCVVMIIFYIQIMTLTVGLFLTMES